MNNGYFPIGNNNMNFGYTPQQQQTQVPTTNMNFVAVENLQKAKEQLVPYGCTIWMRDSNEPYLYVKSVDQVGTPSFKVLNIIDVTDNILQNKNNTDKNDTYVSYEDFNNLNIKIEQLQKDINSCNNALNQMLLVSKEDKKKVGEKNG